MIETALHIHKGITINAYDPTRTTALRNAFVRDMKRRYKELTDVIRQAVDVQDCFGLRQGTIRTFQMTPPGAGMFAFPRSADKVVAFMRWLQDQIDRGLLEVGEFQQIGVGVESAWTNKYILDSYKRGVMRSRYELQKAGFNVPSIEATGGIGISFSTPFHIDRLGLLYSRTFTELKGITAQMDQQISRVLAQGIADGDNPHLLARKLVSTINGIGRDKLGLDISYTRISPKTGEEIVVKYFMPAERRAEIIARTEVIRAHHQAMIQEYRNWALEGVYVKGEWKTAGDARVCEKCAELEGHIYTLDEIEPMIPLHPQCFIDQQVPIYTSEGWKPIGKIEIGDLVLTHKKRFRKVYALPRTTGEKPEVITFKFKGNLKISITANHPVLVKEFGKDTLKWKEAGKCINSDQVMLLANQCTRCNKLIPYFRKYCSRTCLSKDITDKQWSNPEHRKNMSEKAANQLKREYESGTRDKNKITKKANERTRQMVKDGTFGGWMDEDFFNKIREVTNTEEHRKASSERMEQNNPMHDPEIVKKAQHSLAISYLANPENRLNARMAKHRKSGNMTWIEKRLSTILDKLNIEYVFQYPILRYNIDFAIPSLKIVIECDGEYWHQDKEKDLIRQENIEREGWLVLRYSGTKINQHLDSIEMELSRVLLNHTGEYQTIAWPIENIKKWTLKRARMLYNLSVEEDESYIAKGMVVHNCRCIALPYLKKEEVKPVQSKEPDGSTKEITKLSSTQRLNLIKIKSDFEERLGYPPQTAKVIKGSVSYYVVCEGYGKRIVYTVTNRLNIKSSKSYEIK